MTDINHSLAELAANAEERRAALEVEVDTLRAALAEAPNAFDSLVTEGRLVVMEERVRRLEAERDLLEQERDMALYERDRLEHRLAIAHGDGDRQ